MSEFERTFLIVDDEPDILDAIKRLFRKRYNVLAASTAEEAVEILNNETVQVVLTDQRMPGISGVEFLASLRRSHPDVVRVLLTGYSNIDHVIDAINEGHVYRYISKPWNPAELRLFVAQAFEYYDERLERIALVSKLKNANELLEKQNVELSQANEELTTLDQVKNVFMEVVSHELNTPIAVIMGYEFLLRRELEAYDSQIVQKALASIEQSANRLKSISARIFQMLTSDDPEMALDLEEFQYNDLLNDVQSYLSPFLVKRGQTLSITSDNVPDVLRGDYDKIVDILTNLLINAVKFSKDGQTIQLAFRADSNELHIKVADEGIGIESDDLNQIFEPFFSTFRSQYHSSGDFEFGKRGIGLGLSLVRRFVLMHGGRIDVESEEGEGTTFTVHLPLRPERFDSSDELHAFRPS